MAVGAAIRGIFQTASVRRRSGGDVPVFVIVSFLKAEFRRSEKEAV
ncbi:hypothetical protein HMPREF9120_01925 [Neisseria sp. oral taxon 020 str. F0370]|nr:hypothetical protein HMPREF9120_01925 [Neisseria sp. oral taxon 020 str. F0370]